MAKILCSFHACPSVGLYVRSGAVNLTSLKLALNANSSTAVKATHLKQDVNVFSCYVQISRDSPDMTPEQLLFWR